MESNGMGRVQDSRETEKERGRDAECQWKWEMAFAINLIIGENIYGRFWRVIWNNQDTANDGFPTIRIFSLVICKRHFVWLTSCKSCNKQNKTESRISNGRKTKSSLGQVFNFKLGSFAQEQHECMPLHMPSSIAEISVSLSLSINATITTDVPWQLTFNST